MLCNRAAKVHGAFQDEMDCWYETRYRACGSAPELDIPLSEEWS